MLNLFNNMMKLLIPIILLISLSSSGKSEKYGLIIAIGDYPENSGWADLSGSNDERVVNETLLSLGFRSDNIYTIRDQEATKDGILAYFRTLQVKLKEGDIVYIHYSGHGQQVIDDNNEELDKLDEAIVPYDSPQKFQKGIYEGERLIRDDLIGELTDKLRSKCGKSGQLILVLDSCHSGTGTRGMGKARGTNIIMGPENFISSVSVTEQSMNISSQVKNNLSPMACFFGSSARELNYETLDNDNKPVGSLTYSIAYILENMRTSYTFEEFFERVKFKMKLLAPRQNPQWEGPQHEKLFGGSVLQIKDYFKIIEVKADNTVRADIGILTNVFKGTKVEIFSADKNKIISRGEVTNAGMTTSYITCNEPFIKQQDELLQVKVVEQVYPSILVTLCSRLKPNSTNKWDDVLLKLKQLPIIKVDTTNAELYLSENGNVLTLATRDGLVLYKSEEDMTRSTQYANDIELKIRSYVQGNFIKSFENPNSRFKFKVEVLSVDCATQQIIQPFNNNDISLKLGSCAKFKITNEGLNGAYYSLLDIQPDNAINLVLPAVNLGYTAEEYYLKSGESFTTDYVIQINEPLGEETLKLIASKTPQDLSGIISNSGKSKKGNLHLDPFEVILASTFDQATIQNRKLKSPGGDEVGASTLFFKITR